MKLEINIDDEQVAAVLDCAGSRYWCEELEFDDFEVRDGVATCWDALLAGVISKVVVVVGPEGGSTDLHPATLERRSVTVESIRRAFALMAFGDDKNPRVLGQCFSDHDFDAVTGDVLLQLSAFGEVIYG